MSLINKLVGEWEDLERALKLEISLKYIFLFKKIFLYIYLSLEFVPKLVTISIRIKFGI